MKGAEKHVVTGAYGFTGRYIAQQLLDHGHEVITLTNSLHRHNPFADRVKAHPYYFDQPARLAEVLQGVKVLYNTYWVRFNCQYFQHETAVANTLALFRAAAVAGVERIVHVSITNPADDSHLEYFKGKAVLEKALVDTGISYAILRPAVIFGQEDILINNIAWLLRKLPVFPLFGYGSYRVQPVFVEDLAELAVREGGCRDNRIIDAVGPEIYTYRELVEKIGDVIGISRPIVRVSPTTAYYISRLLGKLVKDVIVTREEIKGLMADLLCVDGTPVCPTKLSQWTRKHREHLGCKYMSELGRRLDRHKAYI